MLVTNDVALITFVPLTLGLYRSKGGSQQLIMTVVIETAAANLGSMMTPIGNPQNLFLFSHYEMSMGDFFSAAIPLGICGYLLLCGSVMLVKNGTAELKEETTRLDIGWRLWAYIAVFAVCVLSVAGIVSEYICLALTAAVLLAADRGLFAKVDYPLLATFICFFIFVGNLGNIPTISSFIEKLLSGKELIVSALLSQVISNVPAAAMLAGFTDNAAALLKGVNIGGLGTPVASLASLISFRYYSAAADSRKGKYMAVFLGVNFALLAIMLALGYIIP